MVNAKGGPDESPTAAFAVSVVGPYQYALTPVPL